MAAKTVIVDLSHYNPEPDWPALKAGGVVGVILKATEGQTYVDPTWRQREANAHAAGLKTSTYHFFHGNAGAEMAHYLAEIQAEEGERVCIDHEAEASLQQLCDAVEYIKAQRPDLQITIYSGHLIKEQLGNAKNAVLADNTALWIAQYTSASAPTWPKATWPVWSLWQYTDKANVAGISAGVDGNRFNGSAENAAKWLGPAAAQPEPEPAPRPEPTPGELAIISIQMPPNVPVTVVVNGEVVTP